MSILDPDFPSARRAGNGCQGLTLRVVTIEGRLDGLFVVSEGTRRKLWLHGLPLYPTGNGAVVGLSLAVQRNDDAMLQSCCLL